MNVTSWLKENCKVSGSITINDELVNVDGDVRITSKITRILVKFGVVTGNFNCDDYLKNDFEYKWCKIKKFFLLSL